MIADQKLATVVRGVAAHDSFPAWKARTAENKKECQRLLKAIGRRRTDRWCIEFSLRPVASPLGKGRWVYPRAAWPITFSSEDDAWAFAGIMPMFANSGGRFKSFTIRKCK